MTNEEIENDARKLVELVEKYGAEYGALVIADIIRLFVAQAYGKAAKAQCAGCRADAALLCGTNYHVDAYGTCQAQAIRALKDSLVQVETTPR